MKQLISYLKRYKFTTIFTIILASIAASSSLIIPKLIEKVINNGIMAQGGPDKALMQDYGLIMMGIAVAGLICGIATSFYSAKLSQNIGADMRSDGFKRVQEYSFQDVEKFKTQNLVVRLTNDIQQIQTVIGLLFSTLIRMPILLIGSFILALTTLPQFWYVLIILLVSISLILFIVMKNMIPYFGKFQKQLDRINGTIKENFEGARVVKSFVMEKDEARKFDKDNQYISELNTKIGNIFSIVMPLFMLIANLLTALVIYLAADLAVSDPSVMGSIVSYINYLTQILMALIIGGVVMMQVSRAFVSLSRFNEIMETQPSIEYNQEGISKVDGSIEFKNVSFSYPDSKDVSINDVSFKINSGEKIGVIGATGSGKSTLVHLLLRLFDINQGEILIDGINLKEIPKQVLRDNISIVLQKPILFSGTIKDNLVNGENINQEELIQSASAAQACEFIDKQEDGFSSIVLQRGSNYSGGQKQRLSIARGLIKKPPILVLDDSTSALDSQSEKLVKESLYKDYADQTLIIIAQKITSIIEANKIIVLDKGRVSGFDSHENLLKNNEVYQTIYNTQKGSKNNGTN